MTAPPPALRPSEQLRTPRLLLRKPRLSDAPGIFAAYAADEEVTRYLTWQPHRDVAATTAFVQSCVTAWENGKGPYCWVITAGNEDAPLGMVALRVDDFKADLGYVLARSHWGRGLMTEAVGAVVAWALAQEQIRRVWAVCDVENAASARVLEKCGLQFEGILRQWLRRPSAGNEPVDCRCYAVVK